MAQYIDDAKALYRHALRELGEWRISQDDHTLLRDAAEKTWGAVTEAANEVLFAYNLAVPSGTNARRNGLIAIQRRHRQIRPLNMARRFADFLNVLHKNCFYEGNCPLPTATETIAAAQEFIDDAETLSSAVLSS